MDEPKKKRNKWELAYYLIEAKKSVDSIIFIEENKPALLNIGIRDEVSSLRQRFFINCGVVLDTQFPKAKKRSICDGNALVESIYYERDKNAAHKDIDYKTKDYATLMEMAEEMKSQLACVRQLCDEVLPDIVTLDFVSHDKKLFRQIYQITPKDEENINKIKHPMYGQVPKGAKLLPPKKVFYDIEKIRQIPENEKKEYGVIIDDGINKYEGIQNRQDGCIKINALHGENMWVSFSFEELAKYSRLREIGFLNQYDLIQPIQIGRAHI